MKTACVALTGLLMLVRAPETPAMGLHVELAFRDSVPVRIDELIVEEAARVWAPYGVSVTRATTAAPAGCQTVIMQVEVADKPPANVNDRALGSIGFRRDVPDPAISLYAGTASDLVASVAAGSMPQWTISYYNGVMGRVLGRALAHEIGHYLLHTREHSASGLMRAAHGIEELMAVTDPKMVLSARQQAILRDTWLAEPSDDRTFDSGETAR